MNVLQRGFTLLEVLLTVVIVAMLATITASALQITLQMWEKGEARVEKIEGSRHLLDFIAEDIRAAFPYRTSIENANVAAFFGDRDRINFVTTAPLLSAQTASTGLREVSYWVESGRGLLLREAPLLHTDLFSDERGTVLEVGPNVEKVEFEYLYQAYSRLNGLLENTWSESWGSVEELSGATGIRAQMNFQDETIRLRSLRYLPTAIKVTLTFVHETPEGERATEAMEPVVIPVLQGQLYEAPRQ